jgi:YYY domain-containing protein
VKVFQSNPSLGSFEINDQFAEEAFTVYDHPKVFVFQKTEAYDPEQVDEILSEVDLSTVIQITPKEADAFPGNLLLPPSRLEEQREGGTWSRLFNTEAPHNRIQVLGVVVWYLAVAILGIVVYPLVRFALPGLADRGYPFSRTVGLLVLSYLVWAAGSFEIPFSRATIGLCFLILLAVSAWSAFQQWEGLKEEWQSRRRYFLIVEGIALAVFVAGLLVRFGNPDLWHPWKGGEKPMDFSYFNAVLKSTTFPPYDPWFAGGYINYYYYGFVLVGVPVKFLGIVPAFAYNLILPTLLTMMALGAFSIAWNLAGSGKAFSLRLKAGGAGLLSMAVLGNLGSLRMIIRGFQKIAAVGQDLAEAGIFTRLKWTLTGVFKALTGSVLPFRLDEWYWNPSRVIASEHGSPITEFPAFTFLYGDLHAHLIALPVTLLAVAWGISLIQKTWKVKKPFPWTKLILITLLGGLTVGALRPTNTWDFYPYLALGAVALIYALWQAPAEGTLQRLGRILAGLALFVGFAHLLYQPYARWYGQGYREINFWTGTHTPLSDYFTHWGLFLFMIVSWMSYETLHWMATTPASALRKLEPYKEWIVGLTLLSLLILAALGINLMPSGSQTGFALFGMGVRVIWVAFPLMIWAGLLLFRPNLPDRKRVVLFLIGTALALTLMVEIIVLQGDIGRMNTVFKFYLQAWTLLSISAAASFGWLLSTLKRWPDRVRGVWRVTGAFLILVAAIYPFMGGLAKVKDRMALDAPHNLNGMTYMKHAEYTDLGVTMDLSQDYRAIRWMQENVEGSPVIVEANQVEYHWGTRYTVYTGLPNVVGWNWHQRQQRNLTPHEWVFNRVEAVNNFYTTEDLGAARDFIQAYEVAYIVVGQLERAKYEGPGLEKFPAAEGVLWERVYEDQETVIYRTKDRW